MNEWRRNPNQNREVPEAVKTFDTYREWFTWLRDSKELEKEESGHLVKAGWIPCPSNIPSPFRYAPEWAVYKYQGEPVVFSETAQMRFQVFRIYDCAIRNS